MGNEVKVISKFAEQDKWLSLAQYKHKELIQNKASREVVQKHYLQHVERNEVMQDNLIFDWRKDPKTSAHSVQIYEIRKLSDEEEPNCLAACDTPVSSKYIDIMVYTEHIFKLYEQNPKCILSQREQMFIFKGIVQGIQILAQKFGEFVPTKDMLGYNATKRGKVWIHENFCVNTVQTKRPLKSKEERGKWEKEVIEGLIQMCKLCSIEQSIKNSKFYYVMQVIITNKLYKFGTLKEFWQFKEIDTKVRPKSKEDKKLPKENNNINKEGEIPNSQKIISSNGLVSTEDKKSKGKILNKTFDIPVVLCQVPDRDKTMQQIYFKGNGKNKNERTTVRQTSSPVLHGQKRTQMRHNQTKINANEISLNDAADFNRQQKKKLHPIREVNEPVHYALLDELHEERSARSENKMIVKETMKMVDSVELVQGQDSEGWGYQNNNGRNYVMQESIVLNGKRK